MKKIALQFVCVLACLLTHAQSNPAFMLDSSFGSNGKVVTPQINTGIYQRAYLNSILLLTDGKILAAGTIGKYDDASFDDGVLVKYLPNGNIDTAFGNQGIVYTDYKGQSNGLGKIGKQSSGKIVAISGSQSADLHFSSELVRYNPKGTIDSSFGNKGWLTLPFTISSLAIQTDDKIVVCGQHSDITKGKFAIRVRRYLKNGKTDSTFGENGLTTITIRLNPVYGGAPQVALDYSGRVVIGFYCSSEKLLSNGITVARLTGTGILDSSFNGTGISYGNYQKGSNFFDAICIQPDNKIVAGGYGSNDFMVMRFNENGTEDTNFGKGGEAITDFTPPNTTNIYKQSNDVLRALAVQSDGRIVAVGYVSTYADANGKFAIARYMPDGSADSSFGFAGRTETKMELADAQVSAVAIQQDGNIVSAGYSNNSGFGIGQGGSFALVRYLKKKKTIVASAMDKAGRIRSMPVQKPVSIYPNPAKDILFIKGLSALSAAYEIVNASGRVVQASFVTSTGIDIAALPAGVFYLKISQGGESITLKFIKE